MKQTDAEKHYKWALREIRQNLPNGEEVAAAVEAWVEEERCNEAKRAVEYFRR